MGNKHFVYKHTLKSDGRVYFGQTSNLKQRWRNNGDAYKGCPRFYNAIQKYGWDAFEHTVVSDGLSAKEAKELEMIKSFWYSIS